MQIADLRMDELCKRWHQDGVVIGCCGDDVRISRVDQRRDAVNVDREQSERSQRPYVQ